MGCLDKCNGKQITNAVFFFFFFFFKLKNWMGHPNPNQNTNLTPSLAGSENKQSRVGRPGNVALSTDPSGNTNFLRSSKLCFPGASLITQ